MNLTIDVDLPPISAGSNSCCDGGGTVAAASPSAALAKAAARAGSDDDAHHLEAILRMRKLLEFDADEIADRVYVGSLRSTSRDEELSRRGITHILNLSCRTSPSLERCASRYVVMTVNVLDAAHERIIRKFNECVDFICGGRAAGKGAGAVLICCSRGISRSVTIGCAFLMRERGMGYREALRAIQRKRSIAAPHFSFIGQLQIYERLGHRGEVGDTEFDALYADFVKTAVPDDFFDDPLLMSVSIERPRYASDRDDDGDEDPPVVVLGGSATPPPPPPR